MQQLLQEVHAFFKQHFYKIGKKSSKCEATPWDGTFDILKLFAFFIQYKK